MCSQGAWPVPAVKWLCINGSFRNYWMFITGVCRIAIIDVFLQGTPLSGDSI